MQPSELKPCPFCGAGTTQFNDSGKVWMGAQYSEPISVSVRHWCSVVEGQPSRMIERVGRDRESAIAAWNQRAEAQQTAVPQWAPIATAPRDGTWVLLTGGKCDDDEGDEPRRPVVAQWTTDLNGNTVDGHWRLAWYDCDYYGYYGEYSNPTHWMPLPPPPETQE